MKLEYFVGQSNRNELHAMHEARLRFRDWYEEHGWYQLRGLQVSGSLTTIQGSQTARGLTFYIFTLTAFIPG